MKLKLNELDFKNSLCKTGSVQLIQFSLDFYKQVQLTELVFQNSSSCELNEMVQFFLVQLQFSSSSIQFFFVF